MLQPCKASTGGSICDEASLPLERTVVDVGLGRPAWGSESVRPDLSGKANRR